MRLDAVAELVENEDMFYSIQAVIGRFLDLDHLLSMLVQIPKQETVKTAESKISNTICLKHTLELVEPLSQALQDADNCLIKEFAQVIILKNNVVLLPVPFSKLMCNCKFWLSQTGTFTCMLTLCSYFRCWMILDLSL